MQDLCGATSEAELQESTHVTRCLPCPVIIPSRRCSLQRCNLVQEKVIALALPNGPSCKISMGMKPWNLLGLTWRLLRSWGRGPLTRSISMVMRRPRATPDACAESTRSVTFCSNLRISEHRGFCQKHCLALSRCRSGRRDHRCQRLVGECTCCAPAFLQLSFRTPVPVSGGDS